MGIVFFQVTLKKKKTGEFPFSFTCDSQTYNFDQFYQVDELLAKFTFYG